MNLTQASFVKSKPDPRLADARLRLDVVKRVIEVKLAEVVASEKRAATMEKTAQAAWRS